MVSASRMFQLMFDFDFPQTPWYLPLVFWTPMIIFLVLNEAIRENFVSIQVVLVSVKNSLSLSIHSASHNNRRSPNSRCFLLDTP